ncbi:MAG: hypothetical protein RL757_3007 [Bacteroidota bacterium]|jgi:hypothetical protein
MIRCFALLIALSVVTEKGFSQTETREIPTEKSRNNSIGIELATNQGIFKDQVFSLLNYSQSGKIIGLNYLRYKPTGKNRIEANFNFGSSKLTTRNSDYFTSNSILGNLRFSYLQHLRFFPPSGGLRGDSEKLRVYVGGEYQTQVQYFDWKDLSTFSYLATHGIAVKALATYQLNEKARVETAVTIPLFQSLVRPPYNGIDEFVIANSDNYPKIMLTGDLSTVNKYAALDWQNKFYYQFSKRFDAVVSYNLRYQKVFDEQKFIQLNHQLSLGLNFKF